jgi:hypothetical protein
VHETSTGGRRDSGLRRALRAGDRSSTHARDGWRTGAAWVQSRQRRIDLRRGNARELPRRSTGRARRQGRTELHAVALHMVDRPSLRSLPRTRRQARRHRALGRQRLAAARRATPATRATPPRRGYDPRRSCGTRRDELLIACSCYPVAGTNGGSPARAARATLRQAHRCRDPVGHRRQPRRHRRTSSPRIAVQDRRQDGRGASVVGRGRTLSSSISRRIARSASLRVRPSLSPLVRTSPRRRLKYRPSGAR